jgi:hypothetical protein
MSLCSILASFQYFRKCKSIINLHQKRKVGNPLMLVDLPKTLIIKHKMLLDGSVGVHAA